MSSTPTDAGRGEAKSGEAEGGQAKAAEASSGGGIKSFLPLIIAVVVMPVLAYVTTNFLILPKIKAAMGSSSGATASAENVKPEGEKKEGEKKEGEKKEGSKEGGGKAKVTVPITKILVNVAGTMGTRYLMTSLTLVGTSAELKTKVDENKDQLLDLATSTLSSKTIADLEKPGSRNIIRNELMTVFNNALGSAVVQEIYITEMAIQ